MALCNAMVLKLTVQGIWKPVSEALWCLEAAGWGKPSHKEAFWRNWLLRLHLQDVYSSHVAIYCREVSYWKFPLPHSWKFLRLALRQQAAQEPHWRQQQAAHLQPPLSLQESRLGGSLQQVRHCGRCRDHLQWERVQGVRIRVVAKLPMPELFSRAPLWREGGSMWILPLPRPFQGLFLLSTSSPRSRMLKGSGDWWKLKPGWLSCSWRWWPCRRTLHRLLSKCVAHEYILLKLLFTGSSQPCQPLLLVFLLWRLRQVVKFMRKFGLMPPMYPYKYLSTLYQIWLFCHLPSQ